MEEISQLALEAAKEQVHKEIEVLSQKNHWRDWTDVFGSGHFNNLYVHIIPGCRIRRFLEEERPDLLDIKDANVYNSDLYRSQTRREFYQTIDRDTEDERLDPEEFKHLSKMIDDPNISTFQAQESLGGLTAREAAEKYFFPVYIRSRARGYNHYDITG